jgi:hypothetical protein
MRERAIEMPTEIRRPSARIIGQARTPEAPPLNLTLLGTIAILTFVLHLATGAALYRSHASQMTPVMFGAAGGEVICASETKQPERALPYD